MNEASKILEFCAQFLLVSGPACLAYKRCTNSGFYYFAFLWTPFTPHPSLASHTLCRVRKGVAFETNPLSFDKWLPVWRFYASLLNLDGDRQVCSWVTDSSPRTHIAAVVTCSRSVADNSQEGCCSMLMHDLKFVKIFNWSSLQNINLSERSQDHCW